MLLRPQLILLGRALLLTIAGQSSRKLEHVLFYLKRRGGVDFIDIFGGLMLAITLVQQTIMMLMKLPFGTYSFSYLSNPC